MTILITATKQVLMVVSIVLYKVVVPFKAVEQALKCLLFCTTRFFLFNGEEQNYDKSSQRLSYGLKQF